MSTASFDKDKVIKEGAMLVPGTSIMEDYTSPSIIPLLRQEKSSLTLHITAVASQRI